MKKLLILSLFAMTIAGHSQVTADTSFRAVFTPKYPNDSGPCVCIDSGHNNLHTKETNFKPLAMLLTQDGYKVKSIDSGFEHAKNIEGCYILIISNALHHSNLQNWQLPVPSAFTKKEVRVLNKWVNSGGRLWLIADHMPFAGAANALAQSFGFKYSNGFAQLANKTNGDEQFSKIQGRLVDHPVTNGIPFVVSYTGSAFTYPHKSEPLMKFTSDDISREPVVAWEFNDSTQQIKLKNYSQGALLNYGKGRLAIFGEAAMFTAQLAQGYFKVGFNSPKAPHNVDFTLNIVHWLDQTVKKPSNPKPTPPDLILQGLREMEETFRIGEYEALAYFYSDSAVITGKDVEISGRAAIQKYWNNLQDIGHSWELESIEILNLGDVYLQRGISRMSFVRENQIVKAESKFTLVWIRENDKWVILLDHYSPLQ